MQEFYSISKNGKSLRQSSLFLIIVFILSSFSACSEYEKQIPSPEIHLAGEGKEIEVNVGDTIILEPKITYDINATYEWRKNNIVLDNNQQSLMDTAIQLGRIEYFFHVSTPYGSDSVIIPVDVIILADFKSMQLPAEKDTFWVGSSDSNGFIHKDIFFQNSFSNDSVWTGFGYSNISSTNTVLPIPEYSVYGALERKDLFSLVHQPNEIQDNNPELSFTDGKDHELKSIEISNTTLGYYLMDLGNESFERMGGPGSTDPDWCKINIRGINSKGQPTGEMDFYLADFRFENNRRDYIIDKWTEINLRELGPLNRLQFSISSSKTNDAGEMITPEMFCIDNLKILN